MMSLQASKQTLNREDKLRGSTTPRLTISQKFLHYRNIFTSVCYSVHGGGGGGGSSQGYRPPCPRLSKFQMLNISCYVKFRRSMIVKLLDGVTHMLMSLRVR